MEFNKTSQSKLDGRAQVLLNDPLIGLEKELRAKYGAKMTIVQIEMNKTFNMLGALDLLIGVAANAPEDQLRKAAAAKLKEVTESLRKSLMIAASAALSEQAGLTPEESVNLVHGYFARLNDGIASFTKEVFSDNDLKREMNEWAKERGEDLDSMMVGNDRKFSP